MKILLVTNMYPDAARPANGIFVAEQVAGVMALHPDADFDVCFVDGGKGWREYCRSVAYVNRRISRGRYDLVHIHYGLTGLYLLWPWRKRVPTLVTFHGSDVQGVGVKGLISRLISISAARMAQRCVVLNDRMERLVGRYNSRCHRIPCGVDLQQFQPQERSASHTAVTIVFPGERTQVVKNYPLFHRVLDIITDSYGLDVRERALQGLTRQQVADTLAAADAMLMTSRSEGSPQAVKEAMACGLPVVSVPVGDVPTLLSGVRDCYVSTAGAGADELAALVMKSLSRRGKGVSGRERLRALGPDAMAVAERIYGIYRQMIGSVGYSKS